MVRYQPSYQDLLFGADASRKVESLVVSGEWLNISNTNHSDKLLTTHYLPLTTDPLSLMEIAGKAAAQWILSHPWPTHPQRSLIVCGKGNNGGDGLVVARYLALAGWQVDVLLSSDVSALSPEAAANLKRLRDLQEPGISIHAAATPPDITRLAPPRPILVDALLGTGVKGPVSDLYADLIAAMAASNCPIIAMDLPSGLNADTGVMQGPSLSCVATMNFGTRKRGCYFGDGPDVCGEVIFVDLGFSESVVEQVLKESTPAAPIEYLILAERLQMESPKRSYKYDGCSIIVVGGSTGMVGAPIMAARAAWSLGLGDVRCVFAKGLAEAFHVHLPFLANVAIGDATNDHFEPAMVDAVLDVLNRRDSVLLLGPGLSRHPESLSFVSLLLQSWSGPTLLDADALMSFSPPLPTPPSSPPSSVFRPPSFLLTPHRGELRHLAPGIDEPIAAGDHAAEKYEAAVLAKGLPSVTHTPNGTRYVTGYDTRIFNKVGYGDVLAGLAAGYMALGGDAATSAIAAQIESYRRYLQLSDGGNVADPWIISLPDYIDLPSKF